MIVDVLILARKEEVVNRGPYILHGFADSIPPLKGEASPNDFFIPQVPFVKRSWNNYSSSSSIRSRRRVRHLVRLRKYLEPYNAQRRRVC